jgi:hypothetical protein
MQQQQRDQAWRSGNDNMADVVPRNVTPLVKLRILGVAGTSTAPVVGGEPVAAVLTYWRPDASTLAALAEGTVVRARNLTVDTARGGGASELGLSTSRSVRLQPQPQPAGSLPAAFTPRTCVAWADLAQLENNVEFDTVGVVAEVTPLSFAGSSNVSMQELRLTEGVAGGASLS